MLFYLFMCLWIIEYVFYKIWKYMYVYFEEGINVEDVEENYG